MLCFYVHGLRTTLPQSALPASYTPSFIPFVIRALLLPVINGFEPNSVKIVLRWCDCPDSLQRLLFDSLDFFLFAGLRELYPLLNVFLENFVSSVENFTFVFFKLFSRPACSRSTIEIASCARLAIVAAGTKELKSEPLNSYNIPVTNCKYAVTNCQRSTTNCNCKLQTAIVFALLFFNDSDNCDY